MALKTQDIRIKTQDKRHKNQDLRIRSKEEREKRQDKSTKTDSRLSATQENTLYSGEAKLGQKTQESKLALDIVYRTQNLKPLPLFADKEMFMLFLRLHHSLVSCVMRLDSCVLTLVSFFSFLSLASAQQLDQIGKKSAFKVSGGLGVNQSLYLSSGVNRVAPYSYVFNGNVTFSYAGIAVPLTFTYTNQNFSYTRQPFNIVGLSPTYKNLTLHGGYRNMSFSPYTLSGHNFLGGGVEWKPKIIQVAAMAGRLLKAVEYDSVQTPTQAAFERWGAGLKLGYNNKLGDQIQLIGFAAQDKLGSIKMPPIQSGLKPQENMVLSLGFKKVIFKKLSFQAEGARSAWTQDIRSEQAKGDQPVINNLYFIKQRESTVFYNAYKANIAYQFSFMNLGFGFEHIDPGYRTLGAYYFNSDLENVTINASTSLFKKKVNISGSLGRQRDNLDKTKITQMKRTVGSLNVNYAATKRLNFNASYSNFSSYTNVQPIDRRYLQLSSNDRFDTLSFVQISQSFNGGCTYKINESDHAVRNIALNSSFQTTANKQNTQITAQNMGNATLSYTQSWKKSNISLGFSANGNNSQYTTGTSQYAGLGLNASVPMFKKKLRASLNANANNNYEKGKLTAQLFSVGNNYSLKGGKHHNFSLGFRYTLRNKISESEFSRYNKTFSEFLATLGYNFTF